MPLERIRKVIKHALQGDAAARYRLGLMHELRNRPTRAVKWFRKAAEQGHADAQFALGGAYSAVAESLRTTSRR